MVSSGAEAFAMYSTSGAVDYRQSSASHRNFLRSTESVRANCPGISQFFADLEDLIDSSQAFLRRKSNGSDLSLGISGIMSDLGTGQVTHSPQLSPDFRGWHSASHTQQTTYQGSSNRRIRLRQMLDESFIHTPEIERFAQQLESSPKLNFQPRGEKHSSFLRKANALLESTGEFLKLEREHAEAFDKSLHDMFESIFEPPQTSARRSRRSAAVSSLGGQHSYSPKAVSTPRMDDDISFAHTPQYHYYSPLSHRRPDATPLPHIGHTPPSPSSRGFNPVSSPATGSSYSASAAARSNGQHMRQQLHFSP